MSRVDAPFGPSWLRVILLAVAAFPIAGVLTLLKFVRISIFFMYFLVFLARETRISNKFVISKQPAKPEVVCKHKFLECSFMRDGWLMTLPLWVVNVGYALF